MAKIDAYLRSMERFGAAGAILTSGQAITLRFPQGDRNATQVTPHDQLVGLVREIAPPSALDQIDRGQLARFDVESGGFRYTLDVSPRPNLWQVVISPAAAATAAAPAPRGTPSAPMAAVAPVAPPRPQITDGELEIERGQYDDVTAGPSAQIASSANLDAWTQSARSARATDVFLSAGAPPVMRVNGELQQLGERALDDEAISREMGVVAPAEARGAWTETGLATFAYGDGMGRVRATLTWDHRGPGVALRLLVGEPPSLDRLGLGREIMSWLDGRGLILVGGPSGSGKTTTLAALVRALADRQKRVVTFEDPIEIVHVTSPWVSQRGIGEHVPTVTAGVATAIREGADAIVVGTVSSAEAAQAVLDAVAAGHLVLATIASLSARHAADHLVDLLPVDRRDLARASVQHAHVGTIAPVVKGAGRSFDVVAGRSG